MLPDVREPARFTKFQHEQKERTASTLRSAVDAYLSSLRYMPLWQDYFHESYTQLAAGPVPVLFLWGTEDCTLPWDEAKDMLREIFGPRGASCIMLSGAGHGLCLEDADQVAQLAFAWVRDVQDQNWWNCLAAWRLDTGVGHMDSENLADYAEAQGKSDVIVPPPATCVGHHSNGHEVTTAPR